MRLASSRSIATDADWRETFIVGEVGTEAYVADARMSLASVVE